MELMDGIDYWEVANYYANINPPPVLIPLDKTVKENHYTTFTFDGIQLNHAHVCSGITPLCNWSNCTAYCEKRRSWKHPSLLTASKLPQAYLPNQNERVEYSMRKIQIEKIKSPSTNAQIPTQTFQCFNEKCQCYLTFQSQPNFNSEAVNNDMTDTNNVGSSITSQTQVVFSGRPMPFNSQKTDNHGRQSLVSLLNNPVKNIEKTIQDELRTPLKKPFKKGAYPQKGGSDRKGFNANRTNISEHQHRNLKNYYLTNVNLCPTKPKLNLFMTLNKLATAMKENEYN